MGITIFASGNIADINDIQPLIADIKEIAAGHGWNYHIVCDDFGSVPTGKLTRDLEARGAKIEGSLGLKGIIIETGDGAEPFSILVDRCGVLTDMLQQVAWIESRGTSGRFTSCKTQFANIESHIRFIEVLDLLKRKYIPGLVVND